MVAKSSLPAYPLKVSQNKRYLVDSNETPFFYHADTAWHLFDSLTLSDAEEYLDNRQRLKFNVLQVKLLPEYPYMADREGRVPFLSQGNLSVPNIPYFEHVERVIELAAQRGLLLAINPAWLGPHEFNCWGPVLARNGENKCRDYGYFLGKRFSRFANILWIMGGDRDPEEDLSFLREIALAIKQQAPHQLMTYHASASHSSTDVLASESWLDISMTYTYYKGRQGTPVAPEQFEEVYQACYREYNKTPVKPFILGQAQYEGYHDSNQDGTAHRARKQAYWAFLSGAAGHAYGSLVQSLPSDWKQLLLLPGCQNMAHLYELVSRYPWWELTPDWDIAATETERMADRTSGSLKQPLALDGVGTFGQDDFATVARTADGRLAIIYLPSQPRRLTIDFSQFSGPVIVKRYDPTSGVTQMMTITPVANKGNRQFVCQGDNAAGDADWVLILEAGPPKSG